MSRGSYLTTHFALIVCLVLLLACASSPPPPPVVTQADVVAAEQNDSLEALYDRIETELANAKASRGQLQSLRSLKNEVGTKLASKLSEQIRNALIEGPRIDGALPLPTLKKQQSRIAPMQRWSPTAYDQIKSDLDKELAGTRSAIKQQKARLSETTDTDVEQRLTILEDLIRLSGSNSPEGEKFDAQRKQLIAELDDDVNRAIAEENYDEAKRLLETVKEARPDDTQTVERLADVNTKVFERDFYQALEQGDPDQGYELLTQIAASEEFVLIRPNLVASRDAMAKYYVASGAEQTRKKNIPEAYRRFAQARKIQSLLGDEAVTTPPEELPFRELLEEEYETSISENRPGLAWGYLKVIESMHPSDPKLKRHLRETREIVVQQATKRLTVSAFETPDDTDAEFGDAISSNIVQHLFQAIPNDVRIIEREHLSDIIREHSLQDQDQTKLASADYLVQGTILEAKVDSIDKKGRKTMRVVTEEIEEPNPEYESWTKLSSSKRKDTPPPPKTVLTPRKEDVTVEVIVHRKVGIFSVSYRVIDTQTAKVTFADSARRVAKHDDTSSEGIELGQFRLEFKLSNLPSDTEILTELADEVSVEIGTKLAEVLADPETVYEKSARRYEAEANYPAAAQRYAYAIVLSSQKGKDVQSMTERLRETSIASSGN